AVALGLADAAAVAAAWHRLRERVPRLAPGARVDEVLVEPQETGGREMILGIAADPSLGPLLMAGLGGIHAEALADVTFGVPPVTPLDAREMLAGLRGRRLLEGVRGEAPADQEILVEVIERLSQLACDHPAIVELDVNPFL